jgi:suppressor for copper-sensitivity B
MTTRAILFALLAVAAISRDAVAAFSPWFETDQGEVRLVAESDAVGAAETIVFGLQFRMRPGWKIYWRSPGDAGFPPQLDWSGSDNVAKAEIAWPAPKRFSVLGLETLGYHDEVILPITVTPQKKGAALRFDAKLRYLTCDDICIPYDTELSLALPVELPVGERTRAHEAPMIQRYAALVPKGEGAGVTVTDVLVSDGRTLHVGARAAQPFVSPDVYVEGPPGVSFSAPSISLSPDRITAVLRVASSAPLAAAPLIFTLVDGERSVEARIQPTAAAPAAAPPVDGSFIVAVLLALLGGLILNLMPCVLPVLSLKLLAVVRHGGGETHQVRAGFIATAAGIAVSFLVLGTAAVALKQAGLAAGWGIQFQEPVFLAVMIAILIVFAANLLGLFAVNLPGRVSDRAASVSGSFMTGALATLLATPCSAPFVGTAVGFALARGPADIYAIFLALGIGLAVPYLAVAAWPRIATALPRPGRWMIHLRRVLAVALLGTAMWLGVVLASVTDQDAEIVASGPWRPFEQAAIADEVRLGRVVVVEVTADWCITCKVNQRAVLDRAPVKDRLARPDVTAMLADWTRPDPAISRYLARYGRYGIPFTAVYGPKNPQGEVLPELLTDSAVLQAIARAGGGA